MRTEAPEVVVSVLETTRDEDKYLRMYHHKKILLFFVSFLPYISAITPHPLPSVRASKCFPIYFSSDFPPPDTWTQITCGAIKTNCEQKKL
jgi:hypothetical protein